MAAEHKQGNLPIRTKLFQEGNEANFNAIIVQKATEEINKELNNDPQRPIDIRYSDIFELTFISGAYRTYYLKYTPKEVIRRTEHTACLGPTTFPQHTISDVFKTNCAVGFDNNIKKFYFHIKLDRKLEPYQLGRVLDPIREYIEGIRGKIPNPAPQHQDVIDDKSITFYLNPDEFEYYLTQIFPGSVYFIFKSALGNAKFEDGTGVIAHVIEQTKRNRPQGHSPASVPLPVLPRIPFAYNPSPLTAPLFSEAKAQEAIPAAEPLPKRLDEFIAQLNTELSKKRAPNTELEHNFIAADKIGGQPNKHFRMFRLVNTTPDFRFVDCLASALIMTGYTVQRLDKHTDESHTQLLGRMVCIFNPAPQILKSGKEVYDLAENILSFDQGFKSLKSNVKSLVDHSPAHAFFCPPTDSIKYHHMVKYGKATLESHKFFQILADKINSLGSPGLAEVRFIGGIPLLIINAEHRAFKYDLKPNLFNILKSAETEYTNPSIAGTGPVTAPMNAFVAPISPVGVTGPVYAESKARLISEKPELPPTFTGTYRLNQRVETGPVDVSPPAYSQPGGDARLATIPAPSYDPTPSQVMRSPVAFQPGVIPAAPQVVFVAIPVVPVVAPAMQPQARQVPAVTPEAAKPAGTIPTPTPSPAAAPAKPPVPPRPSPAALAALKHGSPKSPTAVVEAKSKPEPLYFPKDNNRVSIECLQNTKITITEKAAKGLEMYSCNNKNALNARNALAHCKPYVNLKEVKSGSLLGPINTNVIGWSFTLDTAKAHNDIGCGTNEEKEKAQKALDIFNGIYDATKNPPAQQVARMA